MAFHQSLNNFTGGEVTPLLDARLDLQKYQNSCRLIENFRVSPYGGLVFRPGSTYIQATKNNGPAILVDFKFNTTTVYKLEIGANYIRFYRNKANLGPNYEVTTPYTVADLYQLNWKQINSVMYLVHPNYPPQKLSCFSDTNWTLAEVAWTYPALLDQNLNLAISITPSGPAGAITLTASSPLFNAQHVGSYFELAYKRDSTNVQLSLAAAAGVFHSTPIQVKGDWSLVTAQYWYGTLQVERSIDGTQAAAGGWEVIRQFVSNASRNVNGSGSELVNAWLRLTYTATGNPFGVPPWVGTPPANYVPATVVLETSQVFVTGLAKITSFTDSTHVQATTVAGNDMPQVTPCIYWSEGAWSPYRGYPGTVALYEQRILYGGTTYKPNTVWGSASADFDNIQFSDTDDAAISFQIANAQQNRIQWLAAMRNIHIGTLGEEYMMSSANGDEPLSPNNVSIRRESTYGSEGIQPLQIDGGILFIQRQGRRMRELREVSVYANPSDFFCEDLTLMAEHITLGGLKQMAFARLPDPQIFTIRGDGVMPVLTYNKEQNVKAWGRYTTPGAYESVACGYGNPSDEVWVIVNRTIGGVTVRSVEIFENESTDKINGVYLDCCFRRDSGAALNSLTTHLKSATVSVVGDGVLYEGLVTSAAGLVTLPNSATASVWRVGLPYVGTMLPMKLDILGATGSTQARIRNINEFGLRVLNTIGLSFGYTLSNMDEVDWRSITALMDTIPDLFTGDVSLPWNGINDLSGDMYIQQTKPYPATILAIIPEVKFFGT